MSYIQDNLLPDEKILIKSKITPAVFLSPFLVFIFSLFLLGISLNLASKYDEYEATLGAILFCLTGIIFISSLLGAIIAGIRMLTTEFAVTNKRVIARSGFIRKTSLDLLLTKIESVEVKQNMIGRLLKFGTITLTGTGGTHQSFRGILDPISTKQKINQIVEQINSKNISPTEAL